MSTLCACGHLLSQHERAHGHHSWVCFGGLAEGRPRCTCEACKEHRQDEGDEWVELCACRRFRVARPAEAST